MSCLVPSLTYQPRFGRINMNMKRHLHSIVTRRGLSQWLSDIFKPSKTPPSSKLNLIGQPFGAKFTSYMTLARRSHSPIHLGWRQWISKLFVRSWYSYLICMLRPLGLTRHAKRWVLSYRQSNNCPIISCALVPSTQCWCFLIHSPFPLLWRRYRSCGTTPRPRRLTRLLSWISTEDDLQFVRYLSPAFHVTDSLVQDSSPTYTYSVLPAVWHILHFYFRLNSTNIFVGSIVWTRCSHGRCLFRSSTPGWISLGTKQCIDLTEPSSSH